MHVYLEVRALQAAMSTASKSLSSKPPMRILEGVYIEAADDKLLIRCSDLSLQIDCEVAATVEEEGSVVLPGKLFNEIVRKIDGNTAQMKLKGRTMTIKGARARADIQCLDAADFPNMDIKGEVYSVKIPQIVCKDMIRQTVFAAATEETKPILTGLLCELYENEFAMVALDSYRLAMRRYDPGRPYENKEFVVPGRSITEIGRALEEVDETVTLQFSRTHLLIDLGHTRIISRLLDGSYVKYRGLLPVAHELRVRVNREQLLDSIDRAILLSRENGAYLVRFSIEEKSMTITANSPVGMMEEKMDIHLNGPTMEIAFNAKYFSDVLKAIPDDEIIMDLNNNVSPCVIMPVQGKDFYYLILPVMVY